MRRNPFLPVILTVVALVGCSGSVTPEEPRQTLSGTLESRQRAMAEGDVEALFSYWTDDVVIYPVSEPAVTGIAAVREYVRRGRQELGLTPRISPVDVVESESGDLGYILGTYEMMDRDGQATMPGRFVSLWRTNEQGEWKCFLEIHSPQPIDP